MMTKTRLGHRAASAVRPAVLIPSTGVERLRRDDFGGARGGFVVRPGALTALTLPRGDALACAPAVLAP